MAMNDRTGAIAACLIAIFAAANAPAAEPDTTLNEVIVTATRVREPADKALEPVIVIDRAALENSLAVDVGDLLRFHSGLDISRTGAPRHPPSPFLPPPHSHQYNLNV